MTTMADPTEISATATDNHDNVNVEPHSETVSGLFLASLHPLRVAPSEFSVRTRVVLALRRIECLRVEVSTEDSSLYSIQVFHKPPENHIPLRGYAYGPSLATHPQCNHSTVSAMSTRKPDSVVEKVFADLIKLREKLFQLARLGHLAEPCAFCRGVIFYGGYGRAKPHRSMTWLHRPETVREKLSMFLNDILELVAKAKTFHAGNCTGQERIPLAFYRFLQPKAISSRSSAP